jgi:hypothetical protein
MKLAVFTTVKTDAATKPDAGSIAAPSFGDCRALALHQPVRVAARLGRLIDQAARAVEHKAPDRHMRARRLEEAAFYIASLRPTHEESQALKFCVTRLLRQCFDSLDWRRKVLAELRREPVSAPNQKEDLG